MALPINAQNVPVVISAGTSLSTLGAIGAMQLCGILSDSEWTPEAISLQTSFDGDTFVPVVGIGGTLSLGTLAASTFMALDPEIFRGPNIFAVQSGAAGSGVDQTNTTTLMLVCRPVL